LYCQMRGFLAVISFRVEGKISVATLGVAELDFPAAAPESNAVQLRLKRRFALLDALSSGEHSSIVRVEADVDNRAWRQRAGKVVDVDESPQGSHD
jgi:hypothetical protein